MANSSENIPAPNSKNSNPPINGSPQRCVFEIPFDGKPSEQNVIDALFRSEEVIAHIHKKGFAWDRGTNLVNLVNLNYYFALSHDPENAGGYLARVTISTSDYTVQ